MFDDNDDILKIIEDEDLPQLAEIYKKHLDSIPHIYNIINIVIKWRQYERSKKLIRIYSPNNCWKIDGTFILLMEFGCYDLIIFTLDKTCEALIEGLSQTKRINFRRKCLFYCIHPDHYPAILKIIEIKKLKLLTSVRCDMYSIRKDIALNYDLDFPKEVYVRPLDELEVPIITSLSQLNFAGYATYLSTLIEFNGAYGLYLKSDDRLIAWVLMTPMGQIEMLEIISEYRDKNYEYFLTKYMADHIAEEGYLPIGTVIISNNLYKAMFTTLGFQSIGSYGFIGVTLT